MVLEDEFSEQGFPVPGHRVHPVEGYPGADGGEGVPGEIQVGHGVDEEGIVVGPEAEVIRQLPGFEAPYVALADPGHHGVHQLPPLHGGEIVPQDLPNSVVLQARLVQELLRQLLAELQGGDGFLHQVPEVHHLRPVVPQALGEGVVLRLGHLQVRDVVKQQPLQIFRHQVFQLPARTVEHHLPKPSDLAGIMQAGFQPCFRWHKRITPFLRLGLPDLNGAYIFLKRRLRPAYLRLFLWGCAGAAFSRWPAGKSCCSGDTGTSCPL